MSLACVRYGCVITNATASALDEYLHIFVCVYMYPTYIIIFSNHILTLIIHITYITLPSIRILTNNTSFLLLDKNILILIADVKQKILILSLIYKISYLSFEIEF